MQLRGLGCKQVEKHNVVFGCVVPSVVPRCAISVVPLGNPQSNAVCTFRNYDWGEL